MFGLLRLAIYGIVGYAVYTFITDVINGTRTQGGGQSSGGGRMGGGQAAERPMQMTGANVGGGSGMPVQTLDNDGGTVRHRVGRGVI